MKASTLRRRSLRHYWRTNLTVIGGVAIAVAVLAGALMVGVSVRVSLRDLVLQRLGHTDRVVLSEGFFREQLAGAFGTAAPLIVAEGFVTAQESGRRASRVQVYGVDDRFWQFHAIERMNAPTATDALVSEALAAELAAAAGQSVILRIESSSAIPAESLHGRKEDVGRTLRLTVRQVLARENLGEFSLSPRQGSVRAIFLPLRRMQTLIEQYDRVNAILVAGLDAAGVEQTLRQSATVEDVGLRVRSFDELNVIGVESHSTILSTAAAAAALDAADQTGLHAVPTLTYLANSIRAGDRDIPYSTITATDLAGLGWISAEVQTQKPDPIVLNEWAAKDLRISVGDLVSVEYYIWETEGRLATRSAQFRVARIVDMKGPAADRDLVPQYPGITDSARVADWDPPFPIDLNRVRPIDEEYWNTHRATPKAFIGIERGQQLWSSRHGALTALRVVPRLGTSLDQARDAYEKALLTEIDPLEMGLSVYDVRGESLAASTGATDFGEYFTYFSAFLVVSALMLAGLFFKLGVEQRLQEIGLLQAVGLDPLVIRRLFAGEALILAGIGGAVGIAGAIAYAELIMLGLRTWWVNAVGTTALKLHVDLVSLISGAIAVVVIAVASIWWSLRALSTASTRSLLMGSDPTAQKRAKNPTNAALRSDPRTGVAAATGVLALALIAIASLEIVPRVAGFFGAGSLLLVAMLSFASVWLRHGRWGTLSGHGAFAVWRLGWRNAAHRPARSVLCIALVAFATFVIVAVEAFNRDNTETLLDRHSGVGGYPLLMETLLPIVHDLNDSAGRDALNLPSGGELQSVRFDRFRVRPGDDASCLNLYQPKNPRIIAATLPFINSGRFAFHSSLAETPEERANPWLLLNREFGDGAVPVITDANSMTYVLHMKLGEDFVLPGSSEQPIKLRLVAALADSIFQSELIMAERPFVRLFPEREGYRFFLADVDPALTPQVTGVLESRLSDFGVDVASTAERLAGFHRVEYTYLSTFQMLGGLGLLLGTLGLGAILLRNVLERRKELALLRALGYTQPDFVTMVVAENVLLLVFGLAAGTVCALFAIAPAWIDRGGRLPLDTLIWLLLGVLGTGLLASIGATVAALRSPLLAALRTE